MLSGYLGPCPQCDPLGSAIPVLGSFDSSHPTFGCSGNSLSQMAGLEIDVLSPPDDPPIQSHGDFNDVLDRLTVADCFGTDARPFSNNSEDLSVYPLVSRALFQMSRTTSTTPSRVTASGLNLESNLAQPLRNAPTLDGESGCTTSASPGIVTGDKGPNTHWAHCEHIESIGNM